jgi:CRP-like cAMP-binding protein
MTKSQSINNYEHFSFRDLSAKAVYRIRECSVQLDLPKGKIICEQGEHCDWLGLVVSGILRTYDLDEDRTEVVKTFHKENDFFTAPYSFFYGEPAKQTIQAIEPTRILYITRQQYEEITNDFPTFSTFVYRTFSNRFLACLQEKDLLLSYSALDRYLYFLEKHPDLMHRVALGYISSYLGMRQSSLSRIRREVSKGNFTK